MIEGLSVDIAVVRRQLEKIKVTIDAGEIHKANCFKMLKSLLVVVVIGLGMFV